MMDALLEAPWWVPVAVAIFGAGVFWIGNQRQRPAVRTAGGILLIFAALFVSARFVFETDKQRCVRQSRELAHDVQDGKWPQLATLLDPYVSLNIVSGSVYTNREALVKGLRDGVQQYGLKDITVLSTQAQQAQSAITVEMDVLSTQDYTMGRPLPSNWQLEWRRDGKRWLLYRVTCLRIADMDANELRTRFPE